ncbi:MAG: anthranilate phosphoribosyltransferase [Actinomycetia bacterium]|nr:anthranilate phosphoribosyltransferase [Actinomycetes bacterium]MCP4959695.1 anthranilate phosphoribosyltransferase [Actinomycetes bacterium]
MTSIAEHGGWPTILSVLAQGSDLSSQSARAALGNILTGDATDAQIAAFIVALRMKGESVEEISGLVDAMLDNAAPLELPDGAIDIVGTGGTAMRRRAALSVSTMSCFVTATAGAIVAKHGNVGASSTSGSFDTLNALGVTTGLDAAGVRRCIDSTGLAFIHAKSFHPAMRFAGPVRSQLGIPTVFNLLGPLSHPGRVDKQLVGVGDPAVQDRVAATFATRGARRSWVVHGSGLDELTLAGPTRVVEVREGVVAGDFTIDPESVGLATVGEADLAGGGPEDNAHIARDIFSGHEAGPRRDIVALNSGAALLVAGVVDSLVDGVEMAVETIASGAVADKLAAVAEVSAAAAP